MNRAEKTEAIERLRSELGEIRHAVLLDYRGVTVPQVTDLRVQIRKSGGHYAVIKNTLLALATKDTPLAKLHSHMTGPTAIAWSVGEPVALAKALSGFAKTLPAIKVKAVLLDGQALGGEQLAAVATLPSKDELRARVVGLFASPLRRFVTVVSAPSRNLASVLNQRAEKLK